MDGLVVRDLQDHDLSAVLALCQAEDWPSYSSEARMAAAARSPGSTALVAEASGAVVGFAQIQSDTLVEAHLSLLVVAQSHRRTGVARALIAECFARSRTERIDLVTEGDAAEFYRSLPHRVMIGFRIYPPS